MDQPAPAPNVSWEENWEYVEANVKYLLNVKSMAEIEYPHYMTVYSAHYNCCTTSRLGLSTLLGGNPFQPLAKETDDPTTKTDWLGLDIYYRFSLILDAHLKGVTTTLSSLKGSDYLLSYLDHWKRLKANTAYCDRLFSYFNRHNAIKLGLRYKAMNAISSLGVRQWMVAFLSLERSALQDALADVASSESLAEKDLQTFNEVLESLWSFSNLNVLPTSGSTTTEIEFGAGLGPAARRYYAEKWKLALGDGNIGFSEYLKKAQAFVESERNRPGQLPDMLAQCTHAIVDSREADFHDVFDRLVDSEARSDLKALIRFLSLAPECLAPLWKNVEDRLLAVGAATIASLVQENDPAAIKPKAYFDALVHVYSTSRENTHRTFDGDPDFITSFDRAFKSLLNRNGAACNSPTRSAELIVKHADDLLRKRNSVTSGTNRQDLKSLTTLFKYLEDKDIFRGLYALRMAKRLLHGLSTSDDETMVVAAMKETCGAEFTSGLERMLVDVTLSEELGTQFKERLIKDGVDAVDVNLILMNSVAWPVTAAKDPFVAPAELWPIVIRFSVFFNRKFTGRKLIWAWNHSTLDLRLNYLNKPYVVTCSAYQAAILLQFNGEGPKSLEDLCATSGLSREDVLHVVDGLAKAKLLGHKEQEVYDLNLDWKSSKLKINLVAPPRRTPEARSDADQVTERVDSERKYVTQAAVVRVMKTHQTLPYQRLTQEVVAVLSSRFTPKISDIKQAIEALLEKDYIERAQGQRDVITYLA